MNSNLKLILNISGVFLVLFSPAASRADTWTGKGASFTAENEANGEFEITMKRKSVRSSVRKGDKSGRYFFGYRYARVRWH